MSIKANIIIDQGTSFIGRVDVTDENQDPIDLTGCVANGQIRKWYSSLNPAAVFTTNTTADPTNGYIGLSLTPEQTANLVAGRYVYDVKVTNPTNNIIIRVIEGIAMVTPRVTP